MPLRSKKVVEPRIEWVIGALKGGCATHNLRWDGPLEQLAKPTGSRIAAGDLGGSGGKRLGTCFDDRRAANAGDAPSPERPLEGAEADVARVLIIDDDDDARNGLRRLLESEGHEVEEASDGSQALRRFAGSPADLVVTDIFMPHMDGLEFVMRLRETFPEAPIIAMSGGGQMAAGPVLQAAEALGVVRSLAKPLTREVVREALAEALGDA
jgi:CheY-like chemotaxis protein